MADDPRVEAAARAIAEWFEDRGGDPVFLNDGVNERIEPNHAAHEVSIVALAAADEVQAAEVEAAAVAGLDATSPTWRATGHEPSADDLTFLRAALASLDIRVVP